MLTRFILVTGVNVMAVRESVLLMNYCLMSPVAAWKNQQRAQVVSLILTLIAKVSWNVSEKKEKPLSASSRAAHVCVNVLLEIISHSSRQRWSPCVRF